MWLFRCCQLKLWLARLFSQSRVAHSPKASLVIVEIIQFDHLGSFLFLSRCGSPCNNGFQELSLSYQVLNIWSQINGGKASTIKAVLFFLNSALIITINLSPTIRWQWKYEEIHYMVCHLDKAMLIYTFKKTETPLTELKTKARLIQGPSVLPKILAKHCYGHWQAILTCNAIMSTSNTRKVIKLQGVNNKGKN